MPEFCRSPGNSSHCVFSVQQKTVHELWLHCWKWGNARGNEGSLKTSLLGAYFSSQSQAFKRLFFFFKGPALCGKAEHLCEWHHQLRHLPLHPRHLSAHRRRFPEEPAGHVAVSRSSSSGESLVGNACEYHFFHLIWLSLFVLSSLPISSTPWFLFPYTFISYPYDG